MILEALSSRVLLSKFWCKQRVNQILEDMLRVCVISSKGLWEKWLPLAEFSYNNSYQESIKMASFEALYGHKCRTL